MPELSKRMVSDRAEFCCQDGYLRREDTNEVSIGDSAQGSHINRRSGQSRPFCRNIPDASLGPTHRQEMSGFEQRALSTDLPVDAAGVKTG